MHMEHPIKRESIHDSELTEQFEKKSCPGRSSPTIPGSSSSIGAELRRSRTDELYGTIIDRFMRRLIDPRLNPIFEFDACVLQSAQRFLATKCVCVCMCVQGISKRGMQKRIVRKNFLKYFEIPKLDERGTHSFLKRRSRVDRVVRYPPQIGLIGGEYRFLFRLTLELMNMHRVSLGFALILERSGACTGI